ncbi:MAG: hypothetical protein ACRDXB_19565 [Actinomycetes bacterium]
MSTTGEIGHACPGSVPAGAARPSLVEPAVEPAPELAVTFL